MHVHQAINSSRRTSRIAVDGGVWVYWRCNGRDNLSRVRDLSAGGLFIETKYSRPLDVPTTLHFLVEEGQIRAEAVVRHVRRGAGLGLKFTALSDADRPRLTALMARLRTLQSQTKSLPS